MNCIEAKEELVHELSSYLDKVHNLPIHPKFKIRILTIFVYSKIRWPMSIYDLGVTWVKQNCDSLVTNYLRRWLRFHPGANIKHLKLSSKRLGMNLKLPSDIYNSNHKALIKFIAWSKHQKIIYSVKKSKMSGTWWNSWGCRTGGKSHCENEL